MPRFAVANNRPSYNRNAPQILAVATKGGRHLHRAARVNGRDTLTACGEFVTGRYDEAFTKTIIAASGGSTMTDAVTCRHCACITKAESIRRKAAWVSTGM